MSSFQSIAVYSQLNPGARMQTQLLTIDNSGIITNGLCTDGLRLRRVNDQNRYKKGDPEGRRLAKRRAELLAEAERVARSLDILLRRAEYQSEIMSSLVTDLARLQRNELQRAYGHIERRTRFKAKGGQPLQRGLPIKHLYVDESGTSRAPRNDSEEIFALGAIAIDDNEAIRYIAAADAVKSEFFGRTDFQFHEPFMRHREQTKGIDYSFSRDETRSLEFDESIRELILDTDFVAFGVGIRKNGFRVQFLESGLDPYLPTDVYSLAITLLLERYVDALANMQPEPLGRVRMESQGPREDAYHQLEYARLLLEGSQWVSSSAFQSHLEAGMWFSPKRGSDPSELADFFARDLFEWTRSGCSEQPKWWEAFCSKIYVRGDGQMGKFGVKVFPDSDIRDRIEEHRRSCGASPNS